MYKKIILLLITLFLLSLIFISCSSPYGQQGSMKFKDRVGTYENQDKTIKVTVTSGDSQNLNIHTYSGSGIGVIEETFDITSSVTTDNFNIPSKINKDDTYILNFYNNTSLYFSVRRGTDHPINNQELNNSTKQ
ncbi:hypothetical protein [Brachyspira intermedia]|uniref:hypothetical protein n=1 Tax=Brachyspira intermedia TaxID=84377 RepID=UPI00300706A9